MGMNVNYDIRSRFGDFVINGLGSSIVIGKRIKTLSSAFGKNGVNGHKYGTFIGFSEHK